MSIGGIILCGGHSTRMGQPKAWLPFGGECLLQRMVRMLSAVVNSVVVVAAPEQELPTVPTDILVVRDAIPGEGPLRGFAAGLEGLKGQASSAFVTACDAPFLQTAFVRGLAELLGDQAAVVPLIDGQPYPLNAVYRLSILRQVMDSLIQGRRSLRDLLATVSVRYVLAEELRPADPELLSLRNLNTPEEYAEALRLLETLEPQKG